MKPETQRKRRVLMPDIIVHPPVLESFSNLEAAAQVWPACIATDSAFVEQIEARQQLTERLDDVLQSLPRADITVEDAINGGHVTEQQIVQLYVSLSCLLEQNCDYSRVVLYFPFELLPNTTKRQSFGIHLQQAATRFKAAYMSAWERLLVIHDVRANFVNGDVLEVEQRIGDLPRVVKAAHLIPKLVERGLLKTHEVIARMEATNDPVLKDSIADTLPALHDLGFLPGNELQYMVVSEDPTIREAARQIYETVGTVSETTKPQRNTTLSAEPQRNTTLSAIQAYLITEFARIDAVDRGTATPNRLAWLCVDEKQQVIKVVSKAIASAITAKTINSTEFLTAQVDTVSQCAFVEGVRHAVESVARTDTKDARVLYKCYIDTLLSLWQQASPMLYNALTKTFRRLYRLNIIDSAQLAELNLTAPNLAGPFSENLSLMEPELTEIRKMVESIESNEQLAKLIYPIGLVFGSRLKGYGDQGADIDLGILVRPGTPFSERAELEQQLKVTFAHELVQGKVIEFWLKKTDCGLEVQAFTESDVRLGASHDTHILFGGAWMGNQQVVHELRQQLLTPYLLATNEQEARRVHLEELERNALQYRLLHKGYERHYPSAGGINTKRSDRIDGKSKFWDSGFRQIATKLFVSNVFLPKIPS